ncbi:hypothetical protein F8M41_015102 [Gigaspora margarita]|uniref:Uncharacterized protein n=1 Tax=Gigaspora margarita TaxID=4874 RepID=A0A8H4AR10_GIGMA|nr:hypothetical protein F8M41_015102 [Gigaspora margarita]
MSSRKTLYYKERRRDQKNKKREQRKKELSPNETLTNFLKENIKFLERLLKNYDDFFMRNQIIPPRHGNVLDKNEKRVLQISNNIQTLQRIVDERKKMNQIFSNYELSNEDVDSLISVLNIEKTDFLNTIDDLKMVNEELNNKVEQYELNESIKDSKLQF